MSSESEFIKIANDIADIAKELDAVFKKQADKPQDYMHGVPQEEQRKEFYDELKDVSEAEEPWSTSGLKDTGEKTASEEVSEEASDKSAGWPDEEDMHDYMHGISAEEQNAHNRREQREAVKNASEGKPHDYMHGVSAEEQNRMSQKELDDMTMSYEQAVREAKETYGDQSDNQTYYDLGVWNKTKNASMLKDAASRSKALLDEAENLMKIAAWLKERGL